MMLVALVCAVLGIAYLLPAGTPVERDKRGLDWIHWGVLDD